MTANVINVDTNCNNLFKPEKKNIIEWCWGWREELCRREACKKTVAKPNGCPEKAASMLNIRQQQFYIMMWSIYEIIHFWTAVVDKSEEWSSQ